MEDRKQGDCVASEVYAFESPRRAGRPDPCVVRSTRSVVPALADRSSRAAADEARAAADEACAAAEERLRVAERRIAE